MPWNLGTLFGARPSGIRVPFGDDTLRYFAARLDTQRLRQALQRCSPRQAEQSFRSWPTDRLAVDGTGAGWRTRQAAPSVGQNTTPRNRSLVINIIW